MASNQGNSSNYTLTVNSITITNCTNMTVFGANYNLFNDILNSDISYCMNVSENNITLDCHSHLVDGDDDADYGLYLYRTSATRTNTTIRKCNYIVSLVSGRKKYMLSRIFMHC